MTKVIDCREYYQKTLDNAKAYLEWIGRKKSLLIVTNDYEASQVYVRNKVKACEYVGIDVNVVKNATEKDLGNYDAVLVQMPNNSTNIGLLDHINASQDVDGFTISNSGMLLNEGWAIQTPCTPQGIMRIIENEGYDLDGKNVVIVGRSNIVGKPLALMMLQANATVTVCHSHTRNLEDICKQADVLVVAIGKPRYIDSKYVKEGAFVVDVGINRDKDGKLCGDVDFDDVMGKAGYITPVPNGIGKVTVATLINNICRTI